MSEKLWELLVLEKIGSYVAKRAKGYGMNVLYNKHSPDPEAEKSLELNLHPWMNYWQTATLLLFMFL